MSSSDWRSIKDHRENVRLAEIGALLHDMGKCTAEFAYGGPGESYKAVFSPTELGGFNFSPQYYQQRIQEANGAGALHAILVPAVLGPLDTAFSVDGNSYTLRECIYFGRPGWADRADGISRPIGRPADALRLLGFCHGEAHAEKEPPEPDVSPDPRAVYSPFGRQLLILAGSGEPGNLTGKLNSIDFTDLVGRLRKSLLTEPFNEALGDTRFPINEVRLWDWSYAVASLYKSELAHHFLLGGWRNRAELRWRLLRVSFGVLDLYSRAIKVADLLGYRQRIEEACKALKELVEDEYPLGNEVYRDTTGIYFTFPDIDLPADFAQEIGRRVEEVEPELAPRIGADPPTAAKSPQEQLRRLLADQRQKAQRELVTPFSPANLSTRWQEEWDKAGEQQEICPVCRVRPKPESEEVCPHCGDRRKSRTKNWKDSPGTTIWLDEIADHNDRVALIVTKFGLDDWLSGDLVQTLLVKAVENSPSQCKPKNPSPARLRRIWDTCERFWAETTGHILTTHEYGACTEPKDLRTVRLAITPRTQHTWTPNVPYDGSAQGQPISLLWREDAKQFVTIINLQLTRGESISVDQLIARLKGSEITIRDPDNQAHIIALKVAAVDRPAGPIADHAHYRPAIELLASPDQFLALVPASDTIEICRRICEEYAKQFGKVQDRLPLFVGLVFFQRKTPLFAAIDLARRMLSQVSLKDPECGDLGSPQWEVECSRPSPDGLHQCLRLSRDGHRISYCVPVKMGDTKVEDVWYPYFFIEGNAKGRNHRFQFPEDGSGECGFAGRWLVRAAELRVGDRVRVRPSRFAYKFLEHSAQRFEFDPQRDATYLDELPRLIEMWNAIRKTPDMTDTKLRGIASLLEAKKESWGSGSEEFRRLAGATLKQAKLFGDSTAVTPDDVICGRFSQCLEVHLRILKQRVREHDDG